MKYDYKAVEAKWQKVWEDEKTFHVEIDHKKPKFYALVEFPYPSGAGLHVGHPRSYTALDVVSRKRRQNGYNVLYPMGWDAFGLPTENFAMKNHIHPAIVTKSNVDHFRSQLKALGFSFDWDREINTTDPEYYKWTQWIFLQLYKHGLAYKKEMNVNWCTGCKCVLANEEVVNGVCERCGSEVVHRVKSQWMLKITAYADKLIDGLDGLDYIERVSTQQKNWIGRSHGAEVNFGTTAGDTLTVTEKLDGTTKRTYTATRKTTNSFAVTGEYFQKITNGSHTMTVTVTDGKATVTKTFTFTKAVTAASITLAKPMEADAQITLCAITVGGLIPADAVFKVEVTNNGKDSSPVWEDATTEARNGRNHLFTNQTAANGFAFNFRVTAERGASGESGYIASIQGGFQ